MGDLIYIITYKFSVCFNVVFVDIKNVNGVYLSLKYWFEKASKNTVETFRGQKICYSLKCLRCKLNFITALKRHLTHIFLINLSFKKFVTISS